LPPRGETEQVLVEDSGHYQENSRLGCQVEYVNVLDGLKLELAPEF
jgi:ferredoxin, 2Fe-2S